MANNKTSRNFIAVISAMVLSSNLTACDPPMPPDVAAQILEQSYTCEEGAVSVTFPEEMLDPAAQWADSLLSACVDPLPAMSFSISDSAITSDFYVSSYPVDTQICPTIFSVPFAVETAAVAFQLTDSSTLNLQPKTLSDILNGKITNWNDEKIAQDNVGTIFPDLEIQVRRTADELAFQAMTRWMKSLGADLDASVIKPLAKMAFEPLAEGEIAIAPNSQVLNLGLYSVAIVSGVDEETGEQKLAVADNLGVASAASQLVPKKSGNNVTFVLDATIKPKAQEGLNEAAEPYQAIYPVYLNACGEETTLKHAVALFLLRLDSQGVLAASNYNPLAERIRYEALDIARSGLPTPAELPAE